MARTHFALPRQTAEQLHRVQQNLEPSVIGHGQPRRHGVSAVPLLSRTEMTGGLGTSDTSKALVPVVP